MKKIMKNKIIITGALLIIVIIGMVAMLSKESKADPDNTILKTQVVDNLMFENAAIEYENGISTFTVDVYNENLEAYTLQYINIKLTVDDQVITLKGYIGPSLEKDEGRKITASIDKDIRDATKLEYTITK